MRLASVSYNPASAKVAASIAHRPARHAAHVADCAGLVQAGVDDADAWCADADPWCTDTDVAHGAGLVDARIANAGARRADAGPHADAGRTDPDAGVTCHRHTRPPGRCNRDHEGSHWCPESVTAHDAFLSIGWLAGNRYGCATT